MIARWNLVGLVLLAGAITAAAIPTSRILSDYILKMRKDSERMLAALFGAACGFAFWPILAAVVLRYSARYRGWLSDAPYPLNLFAQSGILLGFGLLTVGVPVGLLVLLHRRYRSTDDT